MKIRIANESDFEAIWPIFNRIVSQGLTYAYPANTNKDEAYHLWMANPKATFVCEEDGKILGTFYIKDNQKGIGKHVCNCGYMVSEAARGRGVATAMCEYSQTLAKEYGYKGMQFNFVVSTNSGAIRLWEKLGYKIVGRLPKACCLNGTDYVDALVMYKWFE